MVITLSVTLPLNPTPRYLTTTATFHSDIDREMRGDSVAYIPQDHDVQMARDRTGVSGPTVRSCARGHLLAQLH